MIGVAGTYGPFSTSGAAVTLTAGPWPDYYSPQAGDVWIAEARHEPGVLVAVPSGWTELERGVQVWSERLGRMLEATRCYRMCAGPGDPLPTVHLSAHGDAELLVAAARGVDVAGAIAADGSGVPWVAGS